MLATKVSDAVEFQTHNLTQPTVTPTDRLQHRLSMLSNMLQDQPNMVHDAQLDAISKLCDAV